jgi:hypothetical protein
MKQIALSLIITLISITHATAQTKGTNTLGLGVSVFTQNNEADNQNYVTSKNSNFSIGYGTFFRDNQRLGIDLSLTDNKYENTSGTTYKYTEKGYGGSVNYQRYFPLIKKLYAFGGGFGGLSFSDRDQESSTIAYKSHSYFVGANGGISYFLSRRFALESSLLSASVNYAVQKESNNSGNNSYKNTFTSFNLSSSGTFNNLGFKIYFLF